MRWSEREAINRLPVLLSEFLGGPVEISAEQSKDGRAGPDLVLRGPRLTLIAEIKASGSAASVSAAIRKLEPHRTKTKHPLVVVPYMGDVGRRLCAEHRVHWVDMSGNAYIHAPPVHVHVEGKPNKFVTRGRKSNMFAPKASRVARQLLFNPNEPQTQCELAERTGLGEGYVSRVVRRLEDDRLIKRDRNTRAVSAGDPELLLDAWDEQYDFSSHHVVRGHVPVSKIAVTLSGLYNRLAAQGDVAVTGLSAAWLIEPFAQYRLMTLYIAAPLGTEALDEIGFSETDRGANLWLVVPNDESVLEGRTKKKKLSVVHPLQCYLDLGGHPERAPAARQMLREKYLGL